MTDGSQADQAKESWQRVEPGKAVVQDHVSDGAEDETGRERGLWDEGPVRASSSLSVMYLL